MGESGWDEDSAHTGFLVVRVWVDGDEPPHLRARLHGVVDARGGEVRFAVVAGRDRLLEAIGTWLSDFESGQRAWNTNR